MKQVRYTNGSNSILHSVLYDLWKMTCYVCGSVKQFPDTQIDHILPKSLSLSPAELQELMSFHNLPNDFQLNDPENLALICLLCNGASRKGNDSSLLRRPVMTIALNKAARLSSKVRKDVIDFDNSRAINKAALTVAHANINEPYTQKALNQYARSIVQTIALFDPTKVDHSTAYPILLSDSQGLARVTLDTSGRTAKLFLEQLTGAAFDDVVDEAIAELVKEARPRLSLDISNIRGISPDASMGPVEWEWYYCDIDSLTFERVEDGFTFKFAGTFECTANASIAQSHSSGDGLRSFDGNISVQADPFYVEGVWYLDSLSTGPDNWEVNMDEWAPELWLNA